MTDKVKWRDAAELRATIARLQRELADAIAERDELIWAAEAIMPYLLWTVGPERPVYHPTMTSAIDRFSATFTSADAIAPAGGAATKQETEHDRI